MVNSKYITCIFCFHKSYGVAWMNPYFIFILNSYTFKNTTNQSRVFWNILVTKPTNNTHLNHSIFSQFKRRFGEREVTWTIVRFLYQVCITMKILVNYSVSWTLIEVVFLVWYFPTIHNKKMTYSFTRNSSPKKANFRLLFDLVSMGTRLISHSTIGLGFFS